MDNKTLIKILQKTTMRQMERILQDEYRILDCSLLNKKEQGILLKYLKKVSLLAKMKKISSKKELYSDILDLFSHYKVEATHRWGDLWFSVHQQEFSKAIDEMSRACRIRRVFVYDKEKWGCYDASLLGLYDGTLRWALGKYSVRFESEWYDDLDRFIAKGLNKIGFVKFINKIQMNSLNRAIQRIVKKYPLFVNELISEVSFAEIIKPCISGNISGEHIQNKYWTKA